MHRILSNDPADLSQKTADWIIENILSVLKSVQDYTIALAGGNTPLLLYELLATETYRNRIDWNKLHFFWGDERYVPFEDERNNAGIAYRVLLNKVPVKPEQIHRINTRLTPENAAKDYEKILHKYFPDPTSTFNLVLLGLGKDAHTLSLFPGSPAIMEKKSWVCNVKEAGLIRITLTPPIVNHAKRVAFLVSGKEKMNALKNVFHSPYDPLHYPAQVIHPVNDELYWFADNEAMGNS